MTEDARRNYKTAHQWLRVNFGSATTCQAKHCLSEGKHTVFDWAKKHGKPHAKLRSHYWQLCRPCHLAYDKRSKPRRPKNPYAQALARLRNKKYGKDWLKKNALKMVEARKSKQK